MAGCVTKKGGFIGDYRVEDLNSYWRVERVLLMLAVRSETPRMQAYGH